jgi:oxygen-independent coproporphyrinogen III oxidase
MRPDLIARYADERLPRYTSYPTAPHFTAEIGPGMYAEWLHELPDDAVGSLYVHIPFCRRMCWYCGCNTTVALRDEPVIAYARTLRQEMALIRARLGGSLRVAHVHFGGGTPTILEAGEYLRLMEAIRLSFDVAAEAEIAIEIDPRTLTRAMAKALGEAGVTRASLGVQSLDRDVQAAINRLQSLEDTARAVDMLRRAGVAAINVDLIYGLPLQTVSSCLATVGECLGLRPDRFSVFGYAHVPDFKKHQRKIDARQLPDGAARAAQAEAIADRLQAAGYRRIGMDHFALAGDAMAMAAAAGRLHRNFQGYTTDPAETLIGVGASAIGRLTGGYVQNESVLRAYVAAIGDGRLATAKGIALSEEDRLRAALIERIMCDFRVDIDAVCLSRGRTREHVADAFPALDHLEVEGIIRREHGIVEIEPEARALVRAVAASFDSYRAPSPRRQHSLAL